MATKLIGMKQTLATLYGLGPAVAQTLQQANRENAADILRVAKGLVPSRSGKTRAAIRMIELSPDSILLDFGQKSKVTEGQRGPRPFVNPALRFTKAKRRRRAQVAIRKARRLAARGNA